MAEAENCRGCVEGSFRRGRQLVFFWVGLLVAPGIGAAERLDLPARLGALGFETVSLRRTGQNHWFLFGQIEGRKRSCLVDTGWSFTTVATNTAGRLAETNCIRELKLGRVGLTNVAVRVSDLRVNGQPTAYEVVLGCDFLLRQRAIIDCGNNRLYLRNQTATGNFSRLEMQLARAGWVEIPLQEHQPPALTCPARINDRDTALLVDSGAMWSCLDRPFTGAAGLRINASLNRMTGPGAKQQRAFGVADLKSWSLGSAPMPERTVAVLALGDWGLGTDGKLFPEVHGILGGGELKAGAALIDCGNRKLWLRLKP